MDVIYALLPAMIMLALVSVGAFFWSSRSGQYEDMEGPAHRILDDDDPMLPPAKGVNADVLPRSGAADADKPVVNDRS